MPLKRRKFSKLSKICYSHYSTIAKDQTITVFFSFEGLPQSEWTIPGPEKRNVLGLAIDILLTKKVKILVIKKSGAKPNVILLIYRYPVKCTRMS